MNLLNKKITNVERESLNDKSIDLIKYKLIIYLCDSTHGTKQLNNDLGLIEEHEKVTDTEIFIKNEKIEGSLEDDKIYICLKNTAKDFKLNEVSGLKDVKNEKEQLSVSENRLKVINIEINSPKICSHENGRSQKEEIWYSPKKLYVDNFVLQKSPKPTEVTFERISQIGRKRDE